MVSRIGMKRFILGKDASLLQVGYQVLVVGGRCASPGHPSLEQAEKLLQGHPVPLVSRSIILSPHTCSETIAGTQLMIIDPVSSTSFPPLHSLNLEAGQLHSTPTCGTYEL